MNKYWAILGTVAFFVLSTIVFLVANRRKGGKQNTSVKLKAPGVTLNASSSAGPDAGIVVEDATSTSGRLAAEDNTGRGIRAARIETKGDIKLTNSPPPERPIPKS